MFKIIPNVSFAIPSRIAGAFAAYHINKGNLTKAGKAGTVTTTGAAFFSTREGRAWDSKETKAEYEAAIKAIGYTPKADDPLAWPQKQGVYIEAGKGFIGKAAFFYALSKLSQEAAKAATKAATKPKAETKPKAATKPKAQVVKASA